MNDSGCFRVTCSINHELIVVNDFVHPHDPRRVTHPWLGLLRRSFMGERLRAGILAIEAQLWTAHLLWEGP